MKQKSLFSSAFFSGDKRHTFRLSQHKASQRNDVTLFPFRVSLPKKVQCPFYRQETSLSARRFFKDRETKNEGLVVIRAGASMFNSPVRRENDQLLWSFSVSLFPSLPIPPSRFRIDIPPFLTCSSRTQMVLALEKKVGMLQCIIFDESYETWV